jgi:release factor glutamine methyltransferase
VGGGDTRRVAADIGTKRCIALSLALEGQFERVVATDCSEEAATLARENIARIRPSIPVEVRVGNLLAPLATERCRVIVANPPYLTEEEWAALDPAVREFEPKLALTSGPDGRRHPRLARRGASGARPGRVAALIDSVARRQSGARARRDSRLTGISASRASLWPSVGGGRDR